MSSRTPHTAKKRKLKIHVGIQQVTVTEQLQSFEMTYALLQTSAAEWLRIWEIFTPKCFTYKNIDSARRDAVRVFDRVTKSTTKEKFREVGGWNQFQTMNRGISSIVDMVLDWLDAAAQSIMEYGLKSLHLSITADPNDPNAIIDCLSISFVYDGRTDPTSVSDVSIDREPARKSPLKVKDFQKNLSPIIKQLSLRTALKPTLPKQRYLQCHAVNLAGKATLSGFFATQEPDFFQFKDRMNGTRCGTLNTGLNRITVNNYERREWSVTTDEDAPSQPSLAKTEQINSSAITSRPAQKLVLLPHHQSDMRYKREDFKRDIREQRERYNFYGVRPRLSPYNLVMNCHCGYEENKGRTLKCSICETHQHNICHGLDDEFIEADDHICHKCLLAHDHRTFAEQVDLARDRRALWLIYNDHYAPIPQTFQYHIHCSEEEAYEIHARLVREGFIDRDFTGNKEPEPTLVRSVLQTRRRNELYCNPLSGLGKYYKWECLYGTQQEALQSPGAEHPSQRV